jgi:hypothetical protein
MNYNIAQAIPENYVLAFVIGLLSVFPSLAPTALALKENPTCELYQTAKLENMFLEIPAFYGALHVAIFLIMFSLLPHNMRNYWVLGFIVALIYPSLGTITGHAKKVYGIESTQKLYLSAQVMYLLFYGVVVNFLVTNMVQ